MFSELQENIKRFLSKYWNMVRVKVLGTNNENLDFLLDSFYKLDPQKQSLVLAGGVASLAGVLLLAVLVYFAQIRSLENQLNTSFAALNELKKVKLENDEAEKRFEALIEGVRKKSQGFTSFKAFFENLARTSHVEIKGLNERSVDFDSSSPLADKINESQIEIKIPKVSIPRLLGFLTEIEKSELYLRIQDLKITGQYGNNLYFDVTVMVRAYRSNT